MAKYVKNNFFRIVNTGNVTNKYQCNNNLSFFMIKRLKFEIIKNLLTNHFKRALHALSTSYAQVVHRLASNCGAIHPKMPIALLLSLWRIYFGRSEFQPFALLRDTGDKAESLCIRKIFSIQDRYGFDVLSEQYTGSQRARGGAKAPGHVHRLDRNRRSPPSRVRGCGQLGR